MEYEEEMEEDAPVPLAQQPSFDTTRPKTGQPSEGATKSNSSNNNNNNTTAVRYRECLKNHAVGIGGHATDGCGEFMPSGDEGTMDALKCAACSCHRNFHRKEIEGEIMYPPPSHAPAPAAAALPAHHHNYQFSPYYRAPPPTGYLHITPSGAPQQQQQPRPLALPAASGGTAGGREDEDISNPSSSGGGGSGVIRKRFRTKFTQEQKERMFEFAERLGWRIQKHDEAAVEQFCAENGVQRHVLKVWMHNNKHTLGKKNPN